MLKNHTALPRLEGGTKVLIVTDGRRAALFHQLAADAAPVGLHAGELLLVSFA